MAPEQRTGFRLPWSSDRHAASSTPHAEEQAEPEDGAASWSLSSTSGAAQAEPGAGSSETEADLDAGRASTLSRLEWPAEDMAKGPAAAPARKPDTDRRGELAAAAEPAHAAGSRSTAEAGSTTEAELSAEAESGAGDAMTTADPRIAATEPAATAAAATDASDSGEAGGTSPSGARSHGRSRRSTEPEGTAMPASATAPAGPRPTKFMADLSRAMQAAAQTARDESLARLEAEAKQRIEEIQQLGTSGATELRRKADDDVAATREWSKAEIARIREEAERRITERKVTLEADVEQHAARIRRRADQVREAMATHERDLATFIEQLLAEDDPGRIATLAQNMPEPPALVDLAAGEASPADAAEAAEAVAPGEGADAVAPGEPASEALLGTAGGSADAVALEAAAAESARALVDAHLSAEGAAAAEAEALADFGTAPGTVSWQAAASRGKDRGAGDGEAGRTEVLVAGLASVAGIAGFKRELSRLDGVHAVGVSAGEAGEFVFAVSHDPAADMASAIASITTFKAQVTGSRAGSVTVSASEPPAGE